MRFIWWFTPFPRQLFLFLLSQVGEEIYISASPSTAVVDCQGWVTERRIARHSCRMFKVSTHFALIGKLSLYTLRLYIRYDMLICLCSGWWMFLLLFAFFSRYRFPWKANLWHLRSSIHYRIKLLSEIDCKHFRSIWLCLDGKWIVLFQLMICKEGWIRMNLEQSTKIKTRFLFLIEESSLSGRLLVGAESDRLREVNNVIQSWRMLFSDVQPF